MANFIITIGRQFGSGGHKIGEYLANRLGLSYYDNELILLAAQRGDLHVEHIREMDETVGVIPVHMGDEDALHRLHGDAPIHKVANGHHAHVYEVDPLSQGDHGAGAFSVGLGNAVTCP